MYAILEKCKYIHMTISSTVSNPEVWSLHNYMVIISQKSSYSYIYAQFIVLYIRTSKFDIFVIAIILYIANHRHRATTTYVAS